MRIALIVYRVQRERENAHPAEAAAGGANEEEADPGAPQARQLAGGTLPEHVIHHSEGGRAQAAAAAGGAFLRNDGFLSLESLQWQLEITQPFGRNFAPVFNWQCNGTQINDETPISDAGSSASVGGDSGNSTGSVGSVNSVDGEKAAAAAADRSPTPQPPPPPRPQRPSVRPQQLAALVPSPSPEAAEDSSTLNLDDLDRIETPVTPKQGREQTT